MKTLNIQIADEHKVLNEVEFNHLLDELFGKPDCWVCMVDNRHPFFQNLNTSKSSVFESLDKILTPGHQREIMLNGICAIIVTK